MAEYLAEVLVKTHEAIHPTGKEVEADIERVLDPNQFAGWEKVTVVGVSRVRRNAA